MKRKTAPSVKKPALKRQKTSGLGPQQSALRNQTSLMNALAPEPHYTSVTFNSDATTTPTYVDLANVAAGDTNVSRDGNKIALRACQLRISYTAESIAQNVRARFVLVIDPSSAGVTPVWTDVFDAATIESQRNVSNLPRFQILMDKTVVLNATTSTAGAFQKGFFKKYVKIPNIVANYASAAAAVALTNSITLMYISDIAAGATDLDIAGTSRVYFMG